MTASNPFDIFVFGSNLKGEHAGGAARYAAEHYAASAGVAFGLTGRAYAIPTVYAPGPHPLPLEVIARCVGIFLDDARRYDNLRYGVTAIGTGVAGYTQEQIAPLFIGASDLPNVLLPRPWHQIVYLGHKPMRESFAQ
jgi:hypothetical protein